MYQGVVLFVGITVASALALLSDRAPGADMPTPDAPARAESEFEAPETWPGTQVACLPDTYDMGASPAKAEVRIVLDGAHEIVPAGIGINELCISEMLTQDESGFVELRPYPAGSVVTLGDFLAVAYLPYTRGGYELTVYHNDEPVAQPLERPMRGGDIFELVYEPAVP